MNPAFLSLSLFDRDNSWGRFYTIMPQLLQYLQLSSFINPHVWQITFRISARKLAERNWVNLLPTNQTILSKDLKLIPLFFFFTISLLAVALLANANWMVALKDGWLEIPWNFLLLLSLLNSRVNFNYISRK